MTLDPDDLIDRTRWWPSSREKYPEDIIDDWLHWRRTDPQAAAEGLKLLSSNGAARLSMQLAGRMIVGRSDRRR